MQYETKRVLFKELNELATLFSNSGCRTHQNKHFYKSWQRVLNAHLDYYAYHAGELKERKSLLKAKYAKAVVGLAEQLNARFYVSIRDKRKLTKFGVFGSLFKNHEIKATEINAYLLSVEKEFEQLCKGKPTKVVSSEKNDSSRSTVKKMSPTIRDSKSQVLDVFRPDVCLTIDGVQVSVDDLYKNQAFVLFINTEAHKIRKSKNQAAAEKLKLQIEKLGFDVSIS